MDEKGFLLGYNNRAKVIVRHRRQMPTETQDRSREWITVVECASAGQFMLPPIIIYRGKGMYRGWTSTVDDAGAPFAHSNKGFTTDNLELEWLHRFDTWTSIRAAGAPRFLLLDGHHTHYSESLQFMRYVVAHNIVLMSFPGHSTHLRAGTRNLPFSYCEGWHSRLILLGHGQSWRILRMRISRFAILARKDLGEAVRR